MNYNNNHEPGTENKTSEFAGNTAKGAEQSANSLNKGRKALNNKKNSHKKNSLKKNKKKGPSPSPKKPKAKGVKKASGAAQKGTSAATKGAAAASKAAANSTAAGVKVAQTGGAAFGGGFMSTAIPIIAIVLVAIVALYSIFAILFSGGTSSVEQVSNEAQEILYIFNSFCLTSDDDNKDDYYEIYKEIQDNGYASTLCAIWKTIVEDYYITNQIETWGQKHYKANTDVFDSPFEAVYFENVAKFYLEKENGVYKQKDFDPIDFTKDAYKGVSHHYHYINNAIKMCLDSLVNPKTGHVYEKVDNALQKYKAKHTRELKGKTSDEIKTLCRQDQITKAIHNLEGKNGLLKKCITYEGGVVYNYGTDKEKTKYKKFDITSYIHDEDHNWDINRNTYKLKNGVYVQIFEYDEYFLTASNGDSDDICALALGEVGNGGKKYWSGTKAWTGGADDWCAIFLGWLFEQVGVSPSDVGWSASCSMWYGNANSKHIYHSKNSSYKPQPGDVVFFNYGGSISTHVGLVISFSDGFLYTVEGNTETNDFNTSKVSEGEYQVKYNDAVIGYASMGNFYAKTASSGGKISSGLVVAKTDTSYKGGKVSLNSSERKKIEILVHNELGGGGYTGCCLLAQCMRDAITSKMAKASTMKKDMGYSASDTIPNGGSVCSEAKKAVKDIFDSGKYIVKHRILYMYAPYLCTSKWHETQTFICEFGKGTSSYTRFFDRKG